MMKRLFTSLFLSIVLLAFLPGHANAAGDVALNAANFPDETFRAIVAQQFDTDGNGILSEAEIAKAKGLYCDNKGITDLTGIKNLTSLIVLNCSYNQISTLDLSSCVTLKNVLCYNNGMTSLNLQGCSALEQVDCYGNQLTSLKLQGCAALQSLSCQRNRLTSLDVSSRSGLTKLNCNDNHLTFLDVSNCPALPILQCSNNQLVTLNVSGCTALQKLYCDNSNLSSLNVGSCPALQVLKCDKNSLTSLDVSKNYELTFLSCAENRIPSLDMRSCTKLVRLICNNNHLTTLDLGTCQDLTSLECSGNQLTALDLGTCQNLTSLKCFENRLTALNLSGCRNLDYLFCYMNNLAALDVTPTKLLTVCNPAEYAPFGVGSQKCGDIRVSMTAEQKAFYEKNAETASNLNAGVIPVESFYDADTVTITAQPRNVTLAQGETGIFNVTASGKGLSYQWQWRTSSSGIWTDCSSATSGYNTATLKPVGTAARNGYQYRCIVKDASGNSATSNAATLTVKAALAITTQPVSVSVTVGSTATFKVVVTGASSYQWQWKAPTTNWANCSSATSGYNTATLKPVGTSARNGYQYRCVVKDASGNSVTSNAATLKVLAITTQPVSVSVAVGSTASFKVVATGAASYQWQWRASSTGTWKNCSSATSGYNTANLKPVGTTARNGYQYRCIVKDASGASITSNTATLTVKVPLAITTQPASVSVTEGSTASFKVVATGASSYQWQWRAGVSGTWKDCSSATSGYNTATLKPVGTSARNAYQYRCIVKDTSGASVTSNTATLTVKAGLAITTQPASVTVTEGSTATFQVAATGASSYQWQWRAGTSGTWKDCSSATSGYNTATLKPVGTSARNGYQYRCIVGDASGSSVTSNVVTLTVK